MRKSAAITNCTKVLIAMSSMSHRKKQTLFPAFCNDHSFSLSRSTLCDTALTRDVLAINETKFVECDSITSQLDLMV